MIFGIGLLIVGYAVFYWGMHHFKVNDPNRDWKRYSLWCLLGLQNLNMPQMAPFQFDVGSQTSPQGEQGTGPNPQTGQPGKAPTDTNPGPPQKMGKAPQNWQRDILTGIGAPTNTHNIAKLTAWNACEGNNDNNSGNGSGLPINNPFNVTCDRFVAATCRGTRVPNNTAGVYAYPDWTSGVNATIGKMNEPFARGIKANLVNDGSFADFASNIDSSGWGTSGRCILSYLSFIGGQ